MGLRTDPDHLCFERSPIPGETTCLGGFAEDLVLMGLELKVGSFVGIAVVGG